MQTGYSQCMDTSTISRVHMDFYIKSVLWALLESLPKIHALVGLPEILTVADTCISPKPTLYQAYPLLPVLNPRLNLSYIHPKPSWTLWDLHSVTRNIGRSSNVGWGGASKDTLPRTPGQSRLFCNTGKAMAK